MRYAPLGTTGVQVSPLCLGAMMFGAWGNPDHQACIAIIHRALDEGINFVDTANVYSAGESEEIVGKALKGRRDDVVLATKFHAPMGTGPNDRGNNRKHIFKAVEDSLRRLDTDYIDLYQAHRPDPATDVADTLGALSDIVHQGKVRWIGSSTFPASQIVEAQWAAERRQRERFVCEQPPYSILVRTAELEVLPTCTRHGMGVIVWSPLAGGWLSGRYRKGKPVEASGRAARIPARFARRIAADPSAEVRIIRTKRREGQSARRMLVVPGVTEVRVQVARSLGPPSVRIIVVTGDDCPRVIDHLADRPKVVSRIVIISAGNLFTLGEEPLCYVRARCVPLFGHPTRNPHELLRVSNCAAAHYRARPFHNLHSTPQTVVGKFGMSAGVSARSINNRH